MLYDDKSGEIANIIARYEVIEDTQVILYFLFIIILKSKDVFHCSIKDFGKFGLLHIAFLTEFMKSGF